MTKIFSTRIDDIANYYGFRTTKTPYIKNEELVRNELVDKRRLDKAEEDDFHMLIEEKKSILKKYHENNPQKYLSPILLYHNKPLLKIKKKFNHTNINLDIFGTDRSIAEAIVIKTALSILQEDGFKKIYIDVNSTGDKESLSRFIQELAVYYRKNINLLPEQYRSIIKKDPLKIFFSEEPEFQELKIDAPKPINFLSEQSRRHFKEVLEYLEALDTPYKINNNLICATNSYSKTIFEIKTGDITNQYQNKDILLARGGRYDELAKRIVGKKHISAVGVSINYKRASDIKPSPTIIYKKRIYLIQIGFAAKLKSLKVLDILRQAKIAVYYHLDKDKVSEQLPLIAKLEIPYSILIGQKEASENNVIFRNMDTMAQKTIPIDKLYEYLKQIK